MKKIRMDIDIRVQLPPYSEEMQQELSKEFTDAVMAIFRTVFPMAEPIVRPGAPSPVTVTFTELEEYVPDPSADQISLPTHEEILKRIEEEDRAKRGRRTT
jgi:hypothetical protein